MWRMLFTNKVFFIKFVLLFIKFVFSDFPSYILFFIQTKIMSPPWQVLVKQEDISDRNNMTASGVLVFDAP